MSTTFPNTATRGFASESEPKVAVCLLPGTELAFANDVQYHGRLFWKWTIDQRVGKFNQRHRDRPHRHHDAVEFADGRYAFVTQLVEGQRVTVLQLPVAQPPSAANLAALEKLMERAAAGNRSTERA